MKSIKKYAWLLEWISAALLLAMGIVVLIEKQIILYITGTVFVFMGLFRIVPLVKTTEDKLTKYLYIAEVFIEVICGSYLIYMGTQNKEVGKIYGYIVGGVFYLRGFTHFLATSLRGEPGNKVGFFANMILLTLGAFLIAYGNINSKMMGWIIFGILLICVLFLSIKGIKDYTNFRGTLVTEHKTKNLKLELEAAYKERVELEEQISYMRSEEAIEKTAREKLGLIKEGEILIQRVTEE